MSSPEDRVVAVLEVHYKSSSWAPTRDYTQPGAPMKAGRWSCGCGAGGAVEVGESVTDLWRRHLARRLVAAGLGCL